MSRSDPNLCSSRGCTQRLTGKGVITDRDGRRYCRRCGDRLPSWMRRPKRGKTKARS